MSGKLFVVGTPIGNLQDFSPRGIETLKNADFMINSHKKAPFRTRVGRV